MVHVNTGALTELFSCGKSGTPVIVPLSSGELLLSKENVGIFIGADGKPSRKVHCTYILTPGLAHHIHSWSRLASCRSVRQNKAMATLTSSDAENIGPCGWKQ